MNRMNKEVPVVNIDNRDAGTTWLWISETEYVEVNLQELSQNAAENNPTDELISWSFTKSEWMVVKEALDDHVEMTIQVLKNVEPEEAKGLKEDLEVIELVHAQVKEDILGQL